MKITKIKLKRQKNSFIMNNCWSSDDEFILGQGQLQPQLVL